MQRLSVQIFSILFGVSILISTGYSTAAAQNTNGIAWPSPGYTLTGNVDVVGTAVHPTFRKWQIDLLIDGDEEQAAFVAVGEEEVPKRMTLATLDAGSYPPGHHVLRLRVVHSNLNYDEYSTPINIGVASRRTAPAKPAGDQPANVSLSNVIVDAKNTRPNGTPPPIPSPKANNIAFTPPANGGHWIEIDISDQTLRAWEGDRLVIETLVSTGRPETPTITGAFAVETKYDSQRMRGPGYDLPGVPAVMYFFRNYAIHGAYWHDSFGEVMSHGCVNMRVTEAETLFGWTEIGTPVYVHD